MAAIQILDENTANQIAAGEVVERPASVVKELVENALDADATQVRVFLEDAGKALIRVDDDGCGMGQEDAILSLQRHATSKIRSAGDLFSIETMGFRGEAVPSVASVSQMTILSRRSDASGDQPGVEIKISGGAIESVHEIGARAGTSVTVENLFYNVPARLKFLKTNAAELSQVLDLVQRFALARPDVAFRLQSGASELFASSGGGGLFDACVHVFGRDTARHLLPISHLTPDDIRIDGFLGAPQALKSSRASQLFFVNRRSVRDKTIARALDTAYASVQTLHGRQYPVAVILVGIDPGQVDVNVSPTKTEVRFLREREVFSGVYHAVRNTLIDQGGLAPNITEKLIVPPAAAPAAAPLLDVPVRHPVNTLAPAAGPAEPSWLAPRTGDYSDFASAGPAPAAAVASRGAGDPVAGHKETLRSLRVLAQSRNMYIVGQAEHALVLIDQHIAHERVLYEKYVAGRAGAIPVQHLVMPIPLDLPRRESLAALGSLAELKRAGYDLEPFGAESFLVRSMPAVVAQGRRPEAVLRAIIEDLAERSGSRKLAIPAEDVLIMASCKMAVKAGDPLTFPEMEALITDLLLCENPYTCPHGRPILIELPNHDLDRKFGRL